MSIARYIGSVEAKSSPQINDKCNIIVNSEYVIKAKVSESKDGKVVLETNEKDFALLVEAEVVPSDLVFFNINSEKAYTIVWKMVDDGRITIDWHGETMAASPKDFGRIQEALADVGLSNTITEVDDTDPEHEFGSIEEVVNELGGANKTEESSDGPSELATDYPDDDEPKRDPHFDLKRLSGTLPPGASPYSVKGYNDEPTREIEEDWGSSDTTALMKSMWERIDSDSGGKVNPESIESAALDCAAIYGDSIGYDTSTLQGENDAVEAIIGMFMRRPDGIKKVRNDITPSLEPGEEILDETMEEDVIAVHPDYKLSEKVGIRITDVANMNTFADKWIDTADEVQDEFGYDLPLWGGPDSDGAPPRKTIEMTFDEYVALVYDYTMKDRGLTESNDIIRLAKGGHRDPITDEALPKKKKSFSLDDWKSGKHQKKEFKAFQKNLVKDVVKRTKVKEDITTFKSNNSNTNIYIKHPITGQLYEVAASTGAKLFKGQSPLAKSQGWNCSVWSSKPVTMILKRKT